MKTTPRRIEARRRRSQVAARRQAGVNGVGDALEDFLASYGVTKEWYVEFKEKHGLPPNCGCEARQEWLNKTSDAHPTIANFGVKLLTALTRKK